MRTLDGAQFLQASAPYGSSHLPPLYKHSLVGTRCCAWGESARSLQGSITIEGIDAESLTSWNVVLDIQRAAIDH